MKKIPKKGDSVVNISSGWKGVVIDTNTKQDSSLIKYANNPKREPDWIANNDLKVESIVSLKRTDLRKMIKEVMLKEINETELSNKLFNKSIQLKTMLDDVITIMEKAISLNDTIGSEQRLISLKHKFRIDMKSTFTNIDEFRKILFK